MEEKIMSSSSPVRCAIVLAGGYGRRLWPFIRQLRGDNLPKQYVNFIGTRSMLEHTFYRAEKLIPPGRIFTVLGQDHLKYPEVQQQLSRRPEGTVIVQPQNKDTGPGIFLALAHLYKNYPESTVVVFPSDHFIVEEDLFLAYVGLAFHVVESNPSHLVLLGIEPDEPEPEYGYILVDGEERSLEPLSLHKVRQFVEKPKLDTARELILQGGLWNTMVMVFRSRTLWDLAHDIAPELYESFQQILKALGTPRKRARVEEAYQHMEPMNFSKRLLEAIPLHLGSHLLVLPVDGVSWSDWGSGRRVVSALKENGYLARLRRVSESQLFRIWDGSRRDKKNSLARDRRRRPALSL